MQVPLKQAQKAAEEAWGRIPMLPKRSGGPKGKQRNRTPCFRSGSEPQISAVPLPIPAASQQKFDAFLMELLGSIQYEDITVSMICKNADIDRRTFYRYFDNKQDVLHSYMDNIFSEYLERMERLQSISAIEYLQLFFGFWSNGHRDFLCALQHNKLLYMAFTENQLYLTEISSIMDAMLGRSSNSYETSYRAGGLINVLSAWIANGFAESSDEMAAVISRVLI